MRRRVAPRKDVPVKPLGEGRRIDGGRWAKTKTPANPCAVPLAASTLQLVCANNRIGQIELLGEVLQGQWWHILPPAGKSAFALEEFEQRNEAEAASIGAIPHQLEFVVAQ